MSHRFQHPFRSLGRLTTLGWVLVSAATTIVLLPSRRRSLTARALWLQSSCRAALRALGVAWSVEGRPPETSALIAANHLGYLDILVLAAMTPTVFVAKREVREWPVFGWFARMAGTRFVDRERRGDVVQAGKEMAPVLAEGLRVVLFLEGTSTGGQTVQPFKSSLLEPAIRSRWPIVPAALTYLVPPGHSAEQEVCWWGDMTLPSHLFNLAGLPRIDAFVAWGEPLPHTGNRKILAAALHQRVLRLYRALKEPDDLPPVIGTAELIPFPARN